jgi:hypothetical protein
MSKKIVCTEMRKVVDAQAVIIDSARYRGSEYFGGVFEVWDVDLCVTVDESSGKTMISVRCCWEDEIDHEDAYVELEVHNTLGIIGVIGHDDQVVSRMRFA